MLVVVLVASRGVCSSVHHVHGGAGGAGGGGGGGVVVESPRHVGASYRSVH